MEASGFAGGDSLLFGYVRKRKRGLYQLFLGEAVMGFLLFRFTSMSKWAE